ncbi:MAG: right-handed parallel beta-helix repeat-containing protein, partial [Planctomycetota bacterium]
DTLAPEPNPAEWQVVPTATGLNTIAMEAKAATDDGDVEYMFECVTNGAFSRSWQSSPAYERGDFTAGTSYTFRLRVRDNTNNMTDWSTEETTTTASVVDNLAPAPNPSQWAVEPRKFTETIIGMTAKISTDENGPVEYRFECTSHPAYTRDWSTNSSHMVPGLSYDTYTFTVQARDSATVPNTTTASSPVSVTLSATPGVLEVPSALYGTIQSAINAASDGDTVLVHTGTYTGPGNRELDFHGKAITVRSENPDNPGIVATTIIDCQRSGRAFDFNHGEGADSIVAGFTIRNGQTVNVNGVDSTTPIMPGGNGGDGLGGAIRCIATTSPSLIGSSPTIRNCVITDCTARGGNGGDGADGVPGFYGIPNDPNTVVPPVPSGSDGGNSGSGYGGGIYCDLLCSPIIENCTISDCNAVPGSGGDGGNGLDENLDPDPLLAFFAGDGGDGGDVRSAIGGGIYCLQTSQATIINCTITNCGAAPYTATGGTGGTGGVGPTYGDGSLGSQGGFTGRYEGGGVYLQRAYTNTISDTEISQNFALGIAGGIYCGNNSMLDFINCDILNNFAGLGNGGGVWYGNGGTLTFNNCKVNQNRTPFNNRGGGLYGGVGGAPLTGTTVIINNSTFDGNLSQYGGGIYLDSVELTIGDGSIISDNRATGDGGGMCLVETDFAIDDSIITGNTADFGGGAYWAESIADINNCTISGNFATGSLSSAGAGLYCDDSSANITNCVIQDNDADDRGGAICLAGPYLPGGAQEITNCIITGNTVFSQGAGICGDVGSMPKLNNCTLANNEVFDYLFGNGGGVSCYDAFVEIVNSILWGNIAEYGPQIAIGDPYNTNNPSSTIMLHYSDVEGGEDEIYIGDADDPFLGPWLYLPWPNSVIDADPLFASVDEFEQAYYLSQVAAGQFLENPPNPCVDTGFGFASALASIIGFEPTTRTDHIADTGIVDMGYHYEAAPVTQYQLEIEVVDVGYGTNGRLYADWKVYGVDTTMADPNTATVNQGTQVQFTAVPDEGYIVKEWTGADGVPFLDPCDPNNNIVTMDSSKKVTVEFITLWPSLTTSIDPTGGSGTISHIDAGGNEVVRSDPCRTTHRLKTEVELVATPADSSQVIIWSGTDDDSSTLRYNTVTMDDHKDVTVKFYTPKYWYVGGDEGLPRLQDAIDIAGDRDIIIIAEANEPYYTAWGYEIYDRAITIRSAHPDDPCCVARTVIEQQVGPGGTVRPAFIFYNVGRDTVLNGITIRGFVFNALGGIDGDGDPIYDGNPGSDGFGASILCGVQTGWAFIGGALVEVGAPGSPTIKNCIIADTWVSGGDGGNGADGDDPNIRGGDGGWPGKAGGAGLSVRFNSNPHIINCTFDNCVATGGNGGDGGNGYNDPDDFIDGPGGRGGGWTYGGNSYWFGVPWLFGNHDGIWDGFYDIYTEYTGMGGAVFVDNDCSPLFEYCTFTNCRSEGGTNGICGINGWLPNGRFEPQISYKIPNSGGAVYVADRSEAAFIACVFNNNVADTNGFPAQQSAIVSYGGGAAFKDGATPVFYNCLFSNNLADAGGGMYWKYSSPQISDSIFANNSALHGGGTLFVGGSGVITGSIFNGNLTTGIVGEGGAICSLGANASIINTEINNNTAVSGGGIYISSKDIDGLEISDVNTVLLQNCLIINNIADRDGGGVSANWNSDPDIINCTIADNTATGAGPGIGGGGGLFSCYGNYSKVINSILWGNTSSIGTQVYVGTSDLTNVLPSTVDISYSDVQGGEAAIYVDTHLTDPYYDCEVIWDAGTNLAALPLFISGPLGDYYLSQMTTGQDQDSPCVDSGFGDITNLGLSLTTRIDQVEDAGVIDIGYHYDPRVPTDMHELTIYVIGGNGSISAEGHEATGTPVTYATRGMVNLLADPCDNYIVKQWEGTDNDSSTSPRNTVTMDADRTVTVEFEYHPPTNIIVGSGPMQFATIAPAVAAAYDKDTIIILPNTYTGPENVDIDFQGKSITIRSQNPDDPSIVAQTVIDCGGTEMNNHRGFIFRNGEDANSVLAGLTITNGFIAGAYGGNYVDPNGVIEPNGFDATGDGYGGGILMENSSSPTIRNCVIKNCTVTGGYGGHGVDGGINADGDGIDGGVGGNGFGNGYGGAIYCDTTCSPIVIGCLFEDNRVSGGTGGTGGDGGSPYYFGTDGVESYGGAGGIGNGFGYGAAIYFDQQAKPDVNNCQFINNIATGGVGALGGKLGIGDPNTPRATDGLIGGGIGTGTGGGLYYSEQGVPHIVNSTFNGNAAYGVYYGFIPIGLYESFYRDFETYYRGGGVHVGINNKDVSIRNCDFTDNLGGGLYLVSGAAGVDVDYCSFVSNTASLNGGGVYIGPGCVDVNFVDCKFSANNSDSSGDFGQGGGGLNCKSDVILEYCSFSANNTLGYGGAMNCYRDANSNNPLVFKLDNCSFANNSSTIGGAIYFKNFEAEFDDCYIIGSNAEHGAGLALVDGSVEMNRGVINKNTATAINANGGGISCVAVSGRITNYMFCENGAIGPGSSGGAAYLSANTSPAIVNCLFANNVARRDGGAIAVYFDADAHITNSTFSNNWVDVFGGGIYCDWESSATIKDCIFDKCYNHAVYESEDRGTEVTYSLFNNNPHGAFYGYGDSGSPVDYNDAEIDVVNESDVQLNIGRTGEEELELFVTDGPLGDFYLNQDTGENPAIDGGSAVADTIFVTAGSYMGDYTTHVDNVLDGSSIVDIGYHYADIDTLPRFEVTASVNGGEGSVEIGLEPDEDDGRYYAYAGTVVTLTAKPRSGWRVKAWYGTDDDSSTAKINTVVVSFEDKHITVEFEQTDTLRVKVGGGDDYYSNIQDAVYNAQDGDVIIVLSGVYYGPQIQINKSIVIRSEYTQNPDGVIIDSTGHAGPVFAFGPDCDADTILNGFTIRNSNWFTNVGADGDDEGDNGADGLGAEGGAIAISPDAGPVIKNCIIRDNKILGGFGGNGEDADLTHNAGRGGWGGWARGGGVYCGTNSSPTFINCQIINNQAVGGWGGDGGDEASPGGRANYGGNWSLPNWYNIDPRNLNVELVLGQHLWEKWTEMAQHPGGTWEISSYRTDAFGWEYVYPSLAAVPFVHYGYFGDYRWYSGYGGGVFCNTGSNVTFIDCTISGNLAQGGLSGLAGEEGGSGPLRAKPFPDKYEIPSFGGGVYCAADSTVKFTNCTISNNMSSDPTYDHGIDDVDGRLPEDYDPNNTYRNDPYLGHGGGVCAEDTAMLEFVDCTFS